MTLEVISWFLAAWMAGQVSTSTQASFAVFFVSGRVQSVVSLSLFQISAPLGPSGLGALAPLGL